MLWLGQIHGVSISAWWTEVEFPCANQPWSQTTTSKTLKMLCLFKCVLYTAPTNVRMVTYSSLCQPFLESACKISDPCSEDLPWMGASSKQVWLQSIFYLKIKRSNRVITAARKKANLYTLQKWRHMQHLNLFYHLSANKTWFLTLMHTLDPISSAHPTTCFQFYILQH